VNTPLRRAAWVCLVLFGLLLVNANWVQVVKAGHYRNQPGNLRILLAEYSNQRGAIVARNKEELAVSEVTNDRFKYLRKYVAGPLYAHATGYYSLVYGPSAIERAENAILSGADDRFFVNRMVDLITGEEKRGGNVVLTLDPRVQQAAAEALGNRKGAVVALNPSTGAILAMVSSPSYNPNDLSSHNPAAIHRTWEQLTADPDKPLLNRVLNETYPPGSIFKMVTAAAALATGSYTKDSRVSCPATLPLPQSTRSLPNASGRAYGGSDGITLEEALQVSCNTAFGALGIELGGNELRQQAEKFGVNDNMAVPMKTATSVFPTDIDEAQSALSAIGQFDVRLTPLQAAMIAAGVANRGEVMRPYLVAEIQAPDLSTLERAKPQVLSRAISPDVADQLTAMMTTVVEQGTGQRARISGVTVAGKTGTAEGRKDAKPHAWFISFAPAEDPQVAVAVIVEGGAANRDDISGGKIAAPIAKAAIQAALWAPER